MSGTSQTAQSEWVERVLGVQVGSGGTTPGSGDFKRLWQQSYAAWQDAIDTVDKQMASLATACRETKDPWLMNIADRGLPAVTGNLKTPLMAACLEVTQAAADKVTGPAAKARSAVASFAQHIATDPQVAGCDGNPFGIAVSIRATLGPALESLNSALSLAR